MSHRSLFGILLALVALPQAVSRAAAPLSGEPSAFLGQFASSPVRWAPWGPGAFERARAEKKPVYLFVGSFESELSGAMLRQTFQNPKVAEWMNEHFVCVIVDRNERPEVAALYQKYIADVKQLSGWPLNVWLTPELLPFEGATYLSPSEDWGAPGFLKLASQAQSAWATDPAACRRHAAEAKAQMAEDRPSALRPLDRAAARARLDAAADAWASAYDKDHAGFGDPPRQPEPELMRFLLAHGPASRAMASATLRALAHSPVRDPLDGGFFRYANDPAWRIPYLQKTLADQARIALAYLDGAAGADEADFRICARSALDYALGHLANPDGTFASSLDATAESFVPVYAWSLDAVSRLLGPDAGAFEARRAMAAKGNVSPEDDPSGTYAGLNFLASPRSVEAPGKAEALLLAAREARPAPPRDPRASAAAHGLLIAALARAGSVLGEPRYTAAAERLLGTVRSRFMASDGSLRRFASSGTPAGPEDYAAVALGCRELAAAGRARDSSAFARDLLQRMEASFYDPATGRLFACTRDASGALFERPYASGDAPGAECMAVEAGFEHAPSLAEADLQNLQDSAAQAPGEQLLLLQEVLQGR